jgi:hypothetical protein
MASKLMSEERLAEQRSVVEKALKSKMLNKYDGTSLIGDNLSIMKSHSGEFRNTHQSVFKKCLGKKNCEHCGSEGQLDRAHTKRRTDLVKDMLDEIHPDPTVPISMKVIMEEFVMRHIHVGVWMLCKTCHKTLG